MRQLAMPPDTRENPFATPAHVLTPEPPTAQSANPYTAPPSPQARRAHLELDSRNQWDDLPQLLVTPDGSTRAEHAHYLHQVDPEARDLYERGAVVLGSALIIPHPANSAPEAADQVRLGSLAHAVKTFTPLVGETAAREKASEFVTLGRDIAGRTADGDTRLVVFREFYARIQRDAQGRWRAAPEQATQLENVLTEMRPLAAALREQEWTLEEGEVLRLEDWERGFETRQRDTEHETAGRLTRLLGAAGVEEYAGREHRDTGAQLEALLHTHGTASVSFERRSFADQPPPVPPQLTPAETARLRTEIIPALDWQLENGVPPPVMLTQLARQFAHEERAAHTTQALAVLAARAPEASAPPVSRVAEEARALYTLQALGVPAARTLLQQRGFSVAERAAALDTVGGRLAQDYRAQLGRLQAFAGLEQEREVLAQTVAAFREQQRATPEFRQAVAQLHAQERSDGPQPALRRELAGWLEHPATARAQAENAQHLHDAARYWQTLTGTEITDSTAARTAFAPTLRQQRQVLATLAAERATLPVPRTTHPGQLQPTPLYVAYPAQPNLRLAVASAQEYRLVTATADALQVPLHNYAAGHGPPLGVASEARAAQLNFARAYLDYRLTDDATRLRQRNPLFREFDARLQQARTPAEVRQTVKEIRQENYARAQEPERFAEADARLYGTTAPRPLNSVQLKHLFLAEPPAHYDDAMRDIRRTASLTARDKQERVRGLANGAVPPSPALQVLLQEFDRTTARHPMQTTRNIKAFVSDYLNPPTETRPRFSRHNLYELRQQLAPAERDYFYQVMEQARRNVATVPERARETPARPDPTAERGLARVGELPTAQRQPAPEAPARTVPLAGASTTPTQHGPLEADKLRITLESRIAAYLENVVHTQGMAALASTRAGVGHTTQISHIVKETLREQGRTPAAFGLTDERLAAVAGQLVGALPHALAREYAQAQQLHPSGRDSATRQGLTPETAAPTHSAAVRGATQAALAPWLAEGREPQTALPAIPDGHHSLREPESAATISPPPPPRVPASAARPLAQPPGREGWQR